MSTLHPSVRTHLTLAREQLPEGAHVDAAAALQGVGPYLNRLASAALDVAREGADAYRLIRSGSPSGDL